MKQKDLAEEYATARLHGRLNGNEVSFSENKIFTEEDIKAAFNAGRESVVESMPELEWVETTYNLEDYFLSHNNGWNYRIVFRNRVFCVHLNSNYMGEYLKLSWAKQAANEDYKQRIKHALGL
nr:MAG TPA: hypothetical protein [Caudoviricetes sp.]